MYSFQGHFDMQQVIEVIWTYFPSDIWMAIVFGKGYSKT